VDRSGGPTSDSAVRTVPWKPGSIKKKVVFRHKKAKRKAGRSFRGRRGEGSCPAIRQEYFSARPGKGRFRKASLTAKKCEPGSPSQGSRKAAMVSGTLLGRAVLLAYGALWGRWRVKKGVMRKERGTGCRAVQVSNR